MRVLASAICAVALLGGASVAQAATVLDFEDLAHDGPDSVFYSQLTDYHGFNFTTGQGGFNSYRVWARNDTRNADQGGATLMSNLRPTETRVTRTDGKAFDLLSIDFADYRNIGEAAKLTFIFTDMVGHSTIEQIQLDTQPGLQTVAFNRTDLKAFTYYFVPDGASSGWGQIDNFTLGRGVAAVPEPATWAMMLLGFFGLGSTIRARRAVPARA